MFRLFSGAAIVSLAVACAPADAPTPAASEATPVLSYTDAFIMEPIGTRDMTIGGISLSVEGGSVELTSASSPSVETIELHTMSMVDGKMQMRQVDGFEIDEGETLELKRGGNHFMMFGVGDDVVGGDTIDITLNFDANGEPMTLVVEADVRVVGE